MKITDGNTPTGVSLPGYELTEQEVLGQAPAPLALTTNVITEGMALQVSDLLGRAAALQVQDAQGFKDAGQVLNDLTRAIKSLDDRRLELARPYRDAIAELDLQAKPVTARLAAAKAGLNTSMTAYDAAQREARKQALLEVEQQRLKAEALQAEADVRVERAADKVEAAKTDAGFEKAAAAFDHAMAVKQEALEMAQAAQVAILPEVVKARGTKQAQTVEELTVTDLSLLPLTYHQPDLTKLKHHILDGTLKPGTPGLAFKLGIKFSGTGR